MSGKLAASTADTTPISGRISMKRLARILARNAGQHARFSVLSQLSGISIKFANALAELVDCHRVLVVHPVESLFIEMYSCHVGFLRFFWRKLSWKLALRGLHLFE